MIPTHTEVGKLLYQVRTTSEFGKNKVFSTRELKGTEEELQKVMIWCHFNVLGDTGLRNQTHVCQFHDENDITPGLTHVA